jgi:hypothetical protein
MSLMGSPRLGLPQKDHELVRKGRDRATAEVKKLYELEQHAGRDLPPWVKKLPVKEEVSVQGVKELTKVFYRLVSEKVQTRLSLFATRLTDSKKLDEPFGRFEAIFSDDEIPVVSKVWRSDEEYGYSRLNGLMPHFFAKCAEIPADFKVTEEDLAGRLPAGKTLKDLIEAGRLFIADVCSCLEGVKAVGNNVLSIPRTLFVVTDDQKFLPIAIQLERNGIVFTPNDPEGLWLAVKIHATCAEFQVHTLQVHAVTQHLMMEPVWATMCQTMSDMHPLQAMIGLHMWNMVFVNVGVRDSLMEDKDVTGAKGALQDNLQAGKDGSIQICKNIYTKLNWSEYFDVPKRYAANGVMEVPKYHYRDDSLTLWNAIHDYCKDFLAAVYVDATKDVQEDYELQNWAAAMADKDNGDIRGLPVGKDGKFENTEQVALFLTMVIYQCAVRHSHVENSALSYYPWVPAYPASYKLAIPKTKDDIPLKTIDEALPDNEHTMAQVALIESVNVDLSEVHPLLQVPHEKFQNGPKGCSEATTKFVARLQVIDAEMRKKSEERKGENVVFNDFLWPSELASSIWN